MSSQAERIKAFKLAQHARLQKQDEEEQWISSEELCTEGSSDEETHVNSTKTSHRKQKRNPRTEKRGISPLAQPPKAECESTSSYQRDSKYLLPDAQASGKAVEKQSTPGVDNPDILKIKAECSDLKLADTKAEKPERGSSQAESSKTCTSSLDSETDEDAEIEKMIQWRPKRGSIKLPDFPEEKAPTLEHTIFEAEMLYTEMVAKINFLKRKPVKSKFSIFNTVQTKSRETESLLPSLDERRKDPVINNLLEKISKLDTEISEINVLLESIKKERMFVQEEMCNAISKSDLSHCRNSQTFLHLCHFENNDCGGNDEENNENNKSSDQQIKKQKKIEKGVKNFVTRNIELAKQRSMAQFSLTDEEKIKLESLLSDLDSEEYSVEHLETVLSQTELKPTQEQIKRDLWSHSMLELLDEDDDDKSVNHFKLKKEEMCSMEDLDIKLHEILKSYEDEDRKVKQAQLTINSNGDILETADNEGRYWKQHQLQKRLEIIEKDLAGIAAKDAEELKKLQKQNQQCFEDLKHEVELDNRISAEKG